MYCVLAHTVCDCVDLDSGELITEVLASSLLFTHVDAFTTLIY